MTMGEPQRIRANSILPARREALTLETADGLKLVAELALPAEAAPRHHGVPASASTHGGMMDSQIFRKAAARLPALAQFAVLRFNTRGTSSAQGTSEGEFDRADGERYDVAAAIEYAEFHDLPNIWVVGWSFGTDLAIKYAHDPGVVGAVLLSPPLRFTTEADLAVWRDSGKPLIAIVPEFDDYLRPAEATQTIRRHCAMRSRRRPRWQASLGRPG